MPIYTFTGNNLNVSDLANEVAKKMLSEVKDDFVENYSFTIVTANDSEIGISGILDRMVETKYVGHSLTDEGKKNFIDEYLRVWRKHHDDSDRYISTDSIWYYRNFNRFAVSIGAGFLMDRNLDSTRSYVYSRKDYIGNASDSPAQLKSKLNNYLEMLYTDDEFHTMDPERFCSEVIYILYRIFCFINPADDQKYEALDVWWNTMKLRSMYDVERVEVETFAKISTVNCWLGDLGIKYKFRFRDICGYDADVKMIILDPYRNSRR